MANEPARFDAITDVPGISVGHYTDRRRGTGCTVIRCEGALVAAVDTRGGAPGTRETDALGPATLVQTCHAILLTGGSAFGLAAATGVMDYLAEHDVGFPTTVRKVPIVPAAVLFDLALGSAKGHPDAGAGYRAAAAAKPGRVTEGSVGAGTGATVAKMLGHDLCLKGGIGTASITGPRGLVVGALVANNAGGHIFDPSNGRLIAGPRAPRGRFVPIARAMELRTAAMDALLENTTLIAIATNANLTHGQVHRLAMTAHDGLARVVLPAHTFGDGDVAFAVSMGGVEAQPHDIHTLGLMTVEAVERALVRSVERATTLHNIPSAQEWRAHQEPRPAAGTGRRPTSEPPRR